MCSTSVISTILLDSRDRASQLTSGTSGSRSSASRICCGVKVGPPKSLQATMNGVPCFSSRSMAYQESSMRRVSTSTTAPSVPENSRSHRNQKRSWPGAPNRYSTLRASSVMRPKSKATVVAVLPRTPLMSSTSSPAWVIVSSVLRGRISLTERTMVVFPAPKPPTTTILRPLSADEPSGVRASAVGRVSEVAESNEPLLQDVGVGNGGPARVPGTDPAGREQVGQQDAGDAHRQLQLGGDLHDRGGASGQPQDRRVLGLHAGQGAAFGDYARPQADTVVGGGPAAPLGEGVEPVRCVVPARPAHEVRGWAVRCSPICSTSSLMLCPTSPASASSAVTTARCAPSPASTMHSQPP